MFQIFLYFWWQRSWLYSSDYLVLLSKTVIAVCSSGFGVHQKLRVFAGYLLCASSTGWTLKVCWVVHCLVQWAPGCSIIVAGFNWFGSDWERRHWEIGWCLAGKSSVEMGCTLGGGAFTLGSGGVPGFAVGTLGARCLFVDRVWCARSVGAICAFVYPDQCSMVS